LNSLQKTLGVALGMSMGYSPRKVNKHVTFNVSLWESQHKVNLSRFPIEKKRHDKAKPNKEPLCHQGASLPVVDTMLLLSTLGVDPCLVLAHFSSVNPACFA
jgi:hypothetical protein